MKNQYQGNTLAQALHDLTIRAKGGAIMYLLVWLMLVYWADIYQVTPFAFELNTFLFVMVAFQRLLHYGVHIKYPHHRVGGMYRWLTFLVLFSALHWGILSAWLIEFSPYHQLHYPAIIILAAFAVGGTATLSISHSIRNTYSLFMFLPTILAFLWQGQNDTEDTVLIILATITIFYIIHASAASSRDYYCAITNHRLAEERAAKLEMLSITDALTQLKNRMYFNQRLKEDWKGCNRAQNVLTIMMIDLDHFKQINDRFGHTCGDHCLQTISRVLNLEFRRENDTVARYGGEEFVALLPNTELKHAESIARSLLRQICLTEITCKQQTISLTCSIGIACEVPDHQTNSYSLLNAADHALYRAKLNGRNQYQIASKSDFVPYHF